MGFSFFLPKYLLDHPMNKHINIDAIWIFNGEKGSFPSGAFSTIEKAEEWIKGHGLSGVLTEYPIDIGVYDWALEKGFFKPKRDDQKEAPFIQRFSDARQNHFHYENGEKE
mgnify:CR=1 FL=1